MTDPTTPMMPVSYLVEKLGLLADQHHRLTQTDTGFIPVDDLAIRIIRANTQAILTELDEWAPVRTVESQPTR